ncbi:MAG: GNAT family N-acetyltransferase [Bacteroidetes bacterium]|nr:GNAT family N-acetyltransferase [Bacteroidota bacterium]
MEPILDNPAWTALSTHHKTFAIGESHSLRYRPDVLPFIACQSPESLPQINPYIKEGEAFYLIGHLPKLPENWSLDFELPCAQMLLPKSAPIQPPSHPIEPLTNANGPEMYNLITSIQPGYYAPNTHLLGSYYGIRHQSNLIAMAGERMRLPGYTELSAICTAPGYTGLGYAQSLIAHLCLQHRSQNITTFLHVSLSNLRAIKLYEHLGFQHHRQITFWRLKKHEPHNKTI